MGYFILTFVITLLLVVLTYVENKNLKVYDIVFSLFVGVFHPIICYFALMGFLIITFAWIFGMIFFNEDFKWGQKVLLKKKDKEEKTED